MGRRPKSFEVRDQFWRARAHGVRPLQAAAAAGVSRAAVRKWLRSSGGSVLGRGCRGRRCGCPWASGRRSLAVWPAAAASRGSRGRWAGPRPRCRGKWLATVVGPGIGLSGPTAPPRRARADRSRRSWPSIRGCAPRWSNGWESAGPRSRSRRGWWTPSPTSRRCGCRTRRSTPRCSCSPAARCARSSLLTCGSGPWSRSDAVSRRRESAGRARRAGGSR
jgi:hypothetical protein